MPRARPPRDLELPGRGSELDPARCNVAALSLARDSRSIVNAITVETQQRRVEVSVVLAPGFTPAAGDEAAAVRGQFLRANLSTASGDVRRKYRYYVADEAGDGHWDAASASWRTGPLDLSSDLPRHREGTVLTYVRRLRPGSNTLLSRDSAGPAAQGPARALARLQGPAPAVWDGSGNWQPIAGGWELLDDRLGILVTVEDPESWPIGDYTGPQPQEPSRTLRGITSQANPAAPNTRFVLRLTTVIDDDLMLPAVTGSPAGLAHGLHGAPQGRRARPLPPGDVAAGSLYNPGLRPDHRSRRHRPSPWRMPTSSGPPTSFRPWPAA